MGLIDEFRVQASCRDLQKRTITTYEDWIRKFFVESGRKPAREWTGAMVSQWLHDLDRRRYADAARGVSPLDLAPPPVPVRTIPLMPTVTAARPPARLYTLKEVA